MHDPRDDDPDTKAALSALADAYQALMPATPLADLTILARAAQDADPAAFRAYAQGGQHLLTSVMKAGLDTATGTVLRRRYEGVAPAAKGPQPPKDGSPLELMKFARKHGLR